MNQSYTLIFFVVIILFSSSSLAYRLYPNPYKNDRENVRSVNMKMIVPMKDDIFELKYFILPIRHVSDGK
ncbi:unnamed protein product [Rotaria sp. Silwood2]|nr:unnamed protein product [Rotaria sp. Silwood2]CAF2735156.1 unnamed protein product [Rotaria sp. Silwood2]CAF2902530.1 unnamed protein product [Rotaria sp. Silwood2]